MATKRPRDHLDVGELLLSPGNKELKERCDAFISLAEKRRSSLRSLDSSDYSGKASKAMTEIFTIIQKTRTWQDLDESERSALWNNVQSHVYGVALKHWRSQEVISRELSFTNSIETSTRVLRPHCVGVNPSVLMDPLFFSIVRELRQLHQFQTPEDIIQILTSCKSIVKSLSFSQKNHGLFISYARG